MNRKVLSVKRRREIALMVGAVALILIGIPLAIQLVQSFQNVTPIGEYTLLEEPDFELTPFGTTQTRLGLRDLTTSGAFYLAQNSTVYGLYEHTTVLECSGGTPTGQNLYWFLNTTAGELLETDVYYFRYDIDLPDGNYIVQMIVYSTYRLGSNFFVSQKNLDYNGKNYIYTKDFEGDNLTGWVNLTISDLLQIQVQYPDCNLAIVVINNDADWTTGDLVTWTIEYYDPPTTVSSMTALRYGALIMGVMLTIVGFTSTPWWNPSDANNPGWIDRLLARIFKRKKGGKK